MKQPSTVVFADTQEEKAELSEQSRKQKTRSRWIAGIWSLVALALYLELHGWVFSSPLGSWGVELPNPLYFLVGGELFLMLATGFAIAKLADSKGQTRWWSLLALTPVLNLIFLIAYLLGGFVLLILLFMPTPQKPVVRLRSESETWGS